MLLITITLLLNHHPYEAFLLSHTSDQGQRKQAPVSLEKETNGTHVEITFWTRIVFNVDNIVFDLANFIIIIPHFLNDKFPLYYNPWLYIHQDI